MALLLRRRGRIPSARWRLANEALAVGIDMVVDLQRWNRIPADGTGHHFACWTIETDGMSCRKRVARGSLHRSDLSPGILTR